SARARTPTRSSDRATGFDLYPSCDYTVPAHGRRVCSTDIAIELAPDHYGRICSNSKLAIMHEIVVETGPTDDRSVFSSSTTDKPITELILQNPSPISFANESQFPNFMKCVNLVGLRT
ncbi:MAG: hypothetical protein GY696_19270, partial [Gammaproteobacteria bacterium]|nr:hypothetical protein [Gammaproteobacteria bacterium]